MEMVEFKGNEYPVKFQHVRNTLGKKALPCGGETIAKIDITPDKKKDTNERWFIVGRADCSYKDNFSKKLGRTIALGRLRKAIMVRENERERPD